MSSGALFYRNAGCQHFVAMTVCLRVTYRIPICSSLGTIPHRLTAPSSGQIHNYKGYESTNALADHLGSIHTSAFPKHATKHTDVCFGHAFWKRAAIAGFVVGTSVQVADGPNARCATTEKGSGATLGSLPHLGKSIEVNRLLWASTCPLWPCNR